MTDISQYTIDPTVSAIYKHYQLSRFEGARTYLGASIIGKTCSRALWMDFRQVKAKMFDGRLYRLFETGHLAEPRFIQNLRDVGVTVFDVDTSTGEQWSVSFCGGHFRGHADGVAIGIKGAEKTWHLLEFKTHSEKSFNELKRKGVKTTKPMHYDQMQVYMHGLELTRAYYMAVNKNTDELYAERIKYDADHAKSLIERASRIIYADVPDAPLSDKPSWYECKWCEYQSFCYAGNWELPDVNCRTCIHSTPIADASWQCERTTPATLINTAKPCEHHRFIPHILPNLEFERYADDKVFYRDRGGLVHINQSKGSFDVQA